MLKQPDAVRALAAFKAPSYWPEPLFTKIHENNIPIQTSEGWKNREDRKNPGDLLAVVATVGV